MIEVDRITYVELRVCRLDPDELVAFANLDHFPHRKHLDAFFELFDLCGFDDVYERHRTSIEDRNLGAVDGDDEIGQSRGVDGGEKVLDRSDRNVVLPDSRRVVERGRARLQRGDLEIPQIGSEKNDTSARFCRTDFESRVDSRVESHTFDGDDVCDCFSMSGHYSPVWCTRVQ